jgi:hypothetical protein
MVLQELQISLVPGNWEEVKTLLSSGSGPEPVFSDKAVFILFTQACSMQISSHC